jgi:hypothetical protein
MTKYTMHTLTVNLTWLISTCFLTCFSHMFSPPRTRVFVTHIFCLDSVFVLLYLIPSYISVLFHFVISNQSIFFDFLILCLLSYTTSSTIPSTFHSNVPLDFSHIYVIIHFQLDVVVVSPIFPLSKTPRPQTCRL